MDNSMIDLRMIDLRMTDLHEREAVSNPHFAVRRLSNLVVTDKSKRREMSILITPALAQARQVVVPQIVGPLRPTILLPTAAINGLSLDDLEMILLHDLAPTAPAAPQPSSVSLSEARPPAAQHPPAN